MEVRSVSKALRLLEELSKDPGVFGVSELSRSVDMDKSSVSRMLRTMEQAGFVAQDATSQRYTLGLALAVIGQKALKRINVRDRARGPLERVAAATGECSHLAILAGDRAFYVEQATPKSGISVEAPIGTLAPLYCTALGKVLLAYLPEVRQAHLIKAMQFDLFTRRTIASAEALRMHLETVRQSGLGMDDEEFSVGIRCIAAPVFRHDGEICGAIGISGPSPRVTDERIGVWSDLIREEAANLSESLAHTGTRRLALAS